MIKSVLKWLTIFLLTAVSVPFLLITLITGYIHLGIAKLVDYLTLDK